MAQVQPPFFLGNQLEYQLGSQAVEVRVVLRLASAIRLPSLSIMPWQSISIMRSLTLEPVQEPKPLSLIPYAQFVTVLLQDC